MFGFVFWFVNTTSLMIDLHLDDLHGFDMILFSDQIANQILILFTNMLNLLDSRIIIILM